MTNSDNAFGVFNKKTMIFTQEQVNDSSWSGWQTYANAEAARDAFLSTAAIAIFNECCTQLQWELQSNNRDLKVTFAFGTKGASDQAEADDWAEQFRTRKAALNAADPNGYVGTAMSNGSISWTATEDSNHLF